MTNLLLLENLHHSLLLLDIKIPPLVYFLHEILQEGVFL